MFLISFCSAQSFTVDIPNDLECKDCTIRLVRQALEWSNRYLFWSCADVDILQPRDYAEDCSGNTNARLKVDEKDLKMSHYSKSQIFVQKFDFDKTLQFSREIKVVNTNVFTSFSLNFFWQFFSWNQSCQQLKSPKPQHFHEFFTPKNRQFSREIKVEFLDKKGRFRTV